MNKSFLRAEAFLFLLYPPSSGGLRISARWQTLSAVDNGSKDKQNVPRHTQRQCVAKDKPLITDERTEEESMQDDPSSA